MKLFYDEDGKANYDILTKSTIVSELLRAVDIFLNDNPLPCDNCIESCCSKKWSVEMDNICVNKLSNWDKESQLKFVKDKLIVKRNYYRDFNQYVVKKDIKCIFINECNRCKIYNIRPVICRLYICCDKSYRYNLLRELIGSTYLRALILENRANSNNYTSSTIKNYKRNPAFLAKDYDISIEKIIIYAKEEGWIDEEESKDLYMQKL